MLKAFLQCPEFRQTIFGCKAALTKTHTFCFLKNILFKKVAKSRYKTKSVGKDRIQFCAPGYYAWCQLRNKPIRKKRLKKTKK